MTTVVQLLAFARAFWRCALRPALARAIAVYALAIVATGAPLGAFARSGALTAYPFVVPALAAVWVVALSRVRAPLFGAPETEYLRTLPVARGAIVAAVLVALLCIDVPWLCLCAATGEPSVVAAGGALSLAGHVVLASWRARQRLALLAIYAAACVLLRWLIAPAALALAISAIPWAWTANPMSRATWLGRAVAPAPWLGIARAALICALRDDGTLVRRSLTALAAMTAASALVIRNNHLATHAELQTASLVVLALGAPMVLIRVAARIVEAGWTLAWLYDATGATRRTRSLGGGLAALTSGATFGAIHGLAVALWIGAPLRLVAAEAAVGAALTIVLLGASAAAATPRGLDPLRVTIGVVVVTTAAAFALAYTSALVLAPVATLAALVYHLRVSCS